MNTNENLKKSEVEGHDHGHEHGGRRFGRGRFFLKIPLILAFLAVKGGLILLLWNNLVPEIFHLSEINFAQAIGLMILAKLLIGFGGFGFMGGFGRFGGRGFGGRHGGHCGPGGGRHEFWAKMSPEERQQMREKMRERFRGR